MHPVRISGKIDKILLHPFFGLIILLGLLLVMFQAVFAGAAPFMNMIDTGFTALGEIIKIYIPEGIIQSFLIDGVIAGVGGVVIFLPQIIILFLFILLLEDFGYMSRAAFLMDRIMGSAGLHGRAFIPLLSSFACAIPGIMSTRVIDDRRDRITTILIAPLMTCSARIPVYTLLISAFVPDRKIWNIFNLQGLVMFGLYAAGIAGALGVSFVINKLIYRRKKLQPFMMELPDYKRPRFRGIAIGLWLRAIAFLKRAGTTIFSMSIVIWILATYPLPPEGATEPAISYSFAAMIGNLIQPLLAPLGFNWQISVALIPGMAAREVMVSALSTVYAVSADTAAPGGIADILRNQWSLATALSVLAWYVFAPQCAATLAVIRRELNSTKMAVIAFVYMTVLAYIASLITYNIAILF
jgi:ferrous iron transport protein B